MNKLLPILLSISTLTEADTLIFKNGQHREGTYLGGDARTVKFDAADQIAIYPVTEIEGVHFGPTTVASTAPASLPQQQTNTVQIFAGTAITVRLIDAVKSDQAAPGASYLASVDQPVYWGGRLAIPAQSSAVVQLLDKADAGRLSGQASLTLALTKIEVNGIPYPVQTSENVQASGNRAGTAAKITGGTAAAGAIIGALAGGGHGAAIGAGSGAAAGVAVSALRPGQKLNLSPETKLTFRLAASLAIAAR